MDPLAKLPPSYSKSGHGYGFFHPQVSGHRHLQQVFYEKHGPPNTVTKITELPPVKVGANDVCVKMLASPINPSDINKIQGIYPGGPPLPAIAGYEGVGEVHSIGSAVKDLSPGGLVMAFPPSHGTWQTHVVRNKDFWHKIDSNTPVEYAGLKKPQQFRTQTDYQVIASTISNEDIQLNM